MARQRNRVVTRKYYKRRIICVVLVASPSRTVPQNRCHIVRISAEFLNFPGHMHQQFDRRFSCVPSADLSHALSQIPSR